MKRFLIVDDEELCCALLYEFMSEFALCDTAANGRDGYALFEKAIAEGHPYDLICSDLFMPEMDGHEMVHQVRVREESLAGVNHIRTRIFMVTSSGSTMDMSQAILDNNCDDYIVKPFHLETLKALLQKHDLLDINHQS